MRNSRAVIAAAAMAVLALVLTGGPAASAGNTLLPLGDGHTTTTGAKSGWVFACKIMTGGGGASGATPWISGNMWDPAAKPSVAGSHTWSQASMKVSAAKTLRTIATMGVPVNAVTGTFPIAVTDPVYQYDKNPNTVKATAVTVKVPRSPKLASSPSCLSMGTIGYAINGVAIFNALDGENRDAVAHEMQDACDGHPERTGQYHYHSGSRCLVDKATGASTLIGYALDGFGLYVERDSSGALLTNAALDACHGRTSTVLFNGKKQKMYHYVVTAEYPYTIGCYRGTVLASTLAQVTANQPGGSQSGAPSGSPSSGGTGPTPGPSGSPTPMPSPTGTMLPPPPPPRG